MNSNTLSLGGSSPRGAGRAMAPGPAQGAVSVSAPGLPARSPSLFSPAVFFPARLARAALLVLLAVNLALPFPPAAAQTRMLAQQGSAAGTMMAPPPTKPPFSDAAADQARGHREGRFGRMARPSLSGGQIQEAFTMSDPSQGVHEARDCHSCVHKVHTREMMITTVVLPEDTKITAVDLGDPAGFQARIRAPNVVSVRPNGFGIDTSMTVFAEDGRVYPFYIRSESIHSPNVPDLVVRIHGGGFQGLMEGEDEKPSAVPSGQIGPFAGPPGAPAGAAQPRAAPEDFVERVEFDPATLHGWDDYRLWGDGDLAPEQVFRDNRFTYLHYGGEWEGLDLPAAYVVVDGIDEVVNTRVQGSAYIIETTARLITLKSGLRHLCIEYAPDGGRTGPRNPYRAKAIVSSESWDRRRGP